MQTVSNDYKEQMNRRVRNASLMRVYLGVVNVQAADNATPISTDELHYSNVGGIATNQQVLATYATFEHNRMVLDGSQILPPTPAEPTVYYQGYISESISGLDRRFVTPPIVRIDLAMPLGFIGLTFNFITHCYCYPTEMDIVVYLGGSVVDTITIYPDNAQYTMEQPIPECDRIDLIFRETCFPYFRVRLEQIMFGVTKTFDANNLTTTSWERDVDLLSAKLPKEMFSFTALDIDKDYNPENAEGIWEYVEEGMPVLFEYGYTLDDGSVEWVLGGNYRTSGEITSISEGYISKVTFNSTSELTQLTGTAYKGVYRDVPITLYQLAINVLDHAGIANYEVDEALQDIDVHLPMPAIPFKEALQLIANAGRAVLYTDRTGKIIIRRIDGVLQDFKLAHADIYKMPNIDKKPLLKSVETYYYGLQIDGSNVDLVSKTGLSYATPTEIRLIYEEATNLQVTTTGLTVHGTPELYATNCIVVVSGTGTITIKGKRLNRSKIRVIHDVNNQGYVCPIENELLDNYDDAMAYAEWVADILELRNHYTVDNRGYPELDVLDEVLVDTLFSEDLEARIFYNKIEYNGAISGTTKYVSLGVE